MTTNKILIVGGAGYIGSHVNKLLTASGYGTVVFDNLSTGRRDLARWGEFFAGDLADKKSVKTCFAKHHPVAVMHFGAFAYVGESVKDPAKYYRNNVANTLNLLDAMRDFGAGKFVFSSSCAVYGIPSTIPMKETLPFAPVNPYGRTKKMVEDILEDYGKAYGMKYVNLRYFNAAGADPEGEIGELHEPETHLIPLILDAAIGKTGNIKIFGANYETKDGTCVRDYIHVSDLSRAHLLSLKYLLKGGKSDSFNLGNGRGFSVKEVVRAVEAVTGKKIKVVFVRRRPGDPPALVADPAKAGKILGWRPMSSDLKTIVETAWNWRKKVNFQVRGNKGGKIAAVSGRLRGLRPRRPF